jgi:phosphoribosylanthranilate isomerase
MTAASGRGTTGASESCRRTRIKLCGVTTPEEVDFAIAAGVDALGMIFTRVSPRSVLPHTAMQIARRVPPFVSVVGVFSNPSDPDLMAWSGRWVQLQGREDEPQIQRVARLRSIIKGFSYDPAELRRWDRCTAVSALLVQLPEMKSRNGASSDMLAELANVMTSMHTPISIGGALTPANVGAVIAAVRPHAVDLSAGTESSGAQRSPSLIREFCQAVREADAASA